MKGIRGKNRNGSDERSHAILQLAWFFGLLFLGLCLYFVWFVAVKAPAVIGSSYNPRVDLLSQRVVRGDIRATDGTVLAETVLSEDGTESRVYPYGGVFAPVTGYMQKGKTGVESLANFELLSSHINTLQQIGNDITGVKSPGDNVFLTVDPGLTAKAYEALSERRGAVIAMDPETGRLLCMVSKPDFDPNTIAADWEALNDPENDGGQLLNRAAQGAYPPGSIFKLVTLLAYVKEHPEDYATAFSFSCTGTYIDAEGNEIRCYGGEAHGEQDLFSAFANSCNGAFAKIGAELSEGRLSSAAEALLFNRKLPFSLPYRVSSFSLQETDGLFVREQTAIGQGRTMMSPLHSLLITAAIANGGELMRPQILDHIENAAGETLKAWKPQSYERLLSDADAALLSELMRRVVTEGTGSAFRDAPYEAHAKTGSAEYESEEGRKTHAWCTAFASYGDRSIAVTVLVEDGKSGGSTAAPVARAVLDQWLLPSFSK